MAIQKEFVVRYRAVGHVRFQVPAHVCTPSVAAAIEKGIAAIAGVSSVRCFSPQRKLSIRFDERVCSFKQLATQMVALLAMLERQGGLVEKVTPTSVLSPQLLAKVGDRFKNLKASRWVKGKYSDAKETVQAAKVITKLGMKRPGNFVQDPEKAVIDFLNDILVLYLIKMHWKHVVKLWLPNPFKYRYEWLTVFYLFYLLMRSRKPVQ
ncbi:MAG: hypothetical protein NTV00_05680 [Methylococcales bacterium]|nr:hypothetical protein [Methylococcales bacterium]